MERESSRFTSDKPARFPARFEHIGNLSNSEGLW
jgi:hypothetical protein